MKINELFILHRELETRYKRALEEIVQIDYAKEELNKEFERKQEELRNVEKEVFEQNQKLSQIKADNNYWQE